MNFQTARTAEMQAQNTKQSRAQTIPFLQILDDIRHEGSRFWNIKIKFHQMITSRKPNRKKPQPETQTWEIIHLQVCSQYLRALLFMLIYIVRWGNWTWLSMHGNEDKARACSSHFLLYSDYWITQLVLLPETKGLLFSPITHIEIFFLTLKVKITSDIERNVRSVLPNLIRWHNSSWFAWGNGNVDT